MELITSRQNKRIKHLRALYSTNLGKETGETVLEGPYLLQAARECNVNILEIFMTERFLVENPEWGETGLPSFLVTEEVMDKAAEAVTPQGIIARARRKYTALEELLKSEKLLVLDGIRDPGNAGTLIRTAAAAGMDGVVLLAPAVDPFQPKVLRATAGAIFRIPLNVLQEEGQENFFHGLEEKFSIYLAQTQKGENYLKVQYETPLALILGSETEGLRNRVKELKAKTLSIPLYGGVESLNVAAAGAVLMFSLAK